ncbi:hypothetical protein GCM10011381_01590 [Klenkia taihuensis]|nr:hypothetical protein GCM10011381_01590 [Klenkia taihuensis]
MRDGCAADRLEEALERLAPCLGATKSLQCFSCTDADCSVALLRDRCATQPAAGRMSEVSPRAADDEAPQGPADLVAAQVAAVTQKAGRPHRTTRL